MYNLIALDMDGTLLNSNKEITAESQNAIKKAAQAGKTVILNTGRCVAELEEYFPVISKIRYLNCISGALVYDLQEKKKIYEHPIEPQIIEKLLEIVAAEKAMPHILTDKSIVQKSDWEQMENFSMAQYKEMFCRVAEKWDDLYLIYKRAPFPVAKLNIYHRSQQSRERTVQRIREAKIQVTMAFAETTSLEISAEGIDKGVGLEKLCSCLGLPMKQTIALGDADNDLGAFEKAGLAVAMGNAEPRIKQAADVIVADCDHGGCAQAIENYLLLS